MKKVAIIPLALGVFVGGAAIKLGLDALQKAKADSAQETATVVVATAEIPATSAIDRTMVKVIETPMTPLIGVDAYGDVDKVIGRVAGYSVPRGGVVRESLLAPKGTPAGLAVRIKSGYRAVSVKVNEVTGVAYQIRPGAFVDVIAVMTVNSGRRKQTVSRTILQKIEVAAVGRLLTASTDGKGKAAKSVTLLVKDTEAPKLHLAQTRGKLTLALRSDDDKLDSEDGQSTEGDLLGELAEQVAATALEPEETKPQKPRAIMVVNGLARREHLIGGEQAPAREERPRRTPRRAITVASPSGDAEEDDEREETPMAEIPD